MANTDSAEEVARPRQGEHAWIDAAGTVIVDGDGKTVRSPVNATGAYYKDKATGEEVTFQLPGKVKAGTVLTMLACFGLRTLMTNTASAARQAREKDLDDTSDVEAIRYRLETELVDGKWADPTTRTGGPRFNADTLAIAINAYQPARSIADAAAKIASDPDYGPKAFKNEGVKAHYNRLVNEAKLAKLATKGGSPSADL